MRQAEMFGQAIWIGAKEADVEENGVGSIVIRRSFEAQKGETAKIRLIGLGTFELYVNGNRVSEEYFLPLNSEYEKLAEPEGEELRCRIYCVEYDLTSYLQDGENVLAVLLGFGWYTGTHLWGEVYKRYGEKKLIYTLQLGKGKTSRMIFSDGTERYAPAFVVGGNIHNGEEHDYQVWNENCLSVGFFDAEWGQVAPVAAVDSDYLFTDCPADTVCERLQPKLVYQCEEYALYDAGANVSGYPVLTASKEKGEKVELFFSECLNEAGTDLSPERMHGQWMHYTTDGERELYPRFTWFAFRYFRVHGKATACRVDVIRANVGVDSSFETDNETLNWIYDAFVRTQGNNMHRGIPSDCPHIERLGYTGDGQLCCKSVFHTFDAEAFYRKWIGDICDCQDEKTGHVQYTAPYVLAGGGPGGWGCAIVAVPYEFWKFYGDKKVLEEAYPRMWKYLNFLDEHSHGGVVISDLPGKWCLGDWCTPPDNSTLPAPFVNTYFYIRSAMQMLEIAGALGKTQDALELEKRIEQRKAALNMFYFNDRRDSTYVGNVQGASAFALDIGLGNDLTKEKLIAHYQRNCWYDTGIFGTELVTKALFMLGEADLACKLLTQDSPHGFGKWRLDGATTLLEYWNGRRSHDHPMFGAVVALLFEYIVGIRQPLFSAGYDRVVISPVVVEGLNRVNGSITTPHGKIEVSYQRSAEGCRYEISVPNGVTAELRLPGQEMRVVAGGVYEIVV